MKEKESTGLTEKTIIEESVTKSVNSCITVVNFHTNKKKIKEYSIYKSFVFIIILFTLVMKSDLLLVDNHHLLKA